MSERGKSEKCETCRYRDHLSGTSVVAGDFCGYILRTGRSRGCPSGDECTRWEPKPRAVAKHLLRLPSKKTIFAKFYKER